MRQSLFFALFLLIFSSCEAEPPPPPPAECAYCVVQSAEITGDYVSIPYMGDLWATTWTKEDELLAAFGDATGMNACLPTLILDEPDEFDEAYIEVSPGCYLPENPENEYCEVFGCEVCLPLCQYTPAGLLSLSGPVPDFETCDGPDQCVISRHIPYGDYTVFENSDKPSSILAVNDRVYMPMHYPPGDAEAGHIAYSDDGGHNWKQIPGSPWQDDSPFQVLMFINMGQNYELNRDGYVYGLGIRDELPPDNKVQPVYLARAPLPQGDGPDPILDYASYQYFVGLTDAGSPRWSDDPADAAPLEGLETIAQGAALYHEGAGQYLFLSGLLDPAGAGALFAAPNPWGPWYKVNDLPAGYIPGVIAKDADETGFYFTASGGGPVTYNLNIGRIELTLDQNKKQPRPSLSLIETRKVEQIIGDFDFETEGLTRQRTGERFNVYFTDLGSPFEHKGKLWLLFGDTDPESPGWDEYHDDAIAYTEAESADDFWLTFLTDPNRGRGLANPVIACPQENNPDCMDLGTLNVPVAGLSDGETMFVWFTTDAAGRSLLARSDDDGRTFVKVYDFGDTHFIDVFAQRYDGAIPGLQGDGPWALIFGSGDQEHNQVYLAAAPIQSLRDGDRAAVRFLSVISHKPDGSVALTWSSRESDSTPIFTIEHGDGPGVMSEVPHAWGFGEPLVYYEKKLGLWLATYNAARTSIRLRTASHPWGPWSASMILFDPAVDYGQGPAFGRYIGDGKSDRFGGGVGELYGPYVLPRFTRILPDGRVKLYWLLSPWQPYVVYLMESALRPAP